VRRDDTEVKVRYRVLIAADGPHSPVAAQLGLEPLEVVQTRQYTVPLLRPYADTDIWLSDEYPGGYAWLFPKGDLANLGLGADRRWEDNLKEPLDRLHRQLMDAGLLGGRSSTAQGAPSPWAACANVSWWATCCSRGDAAGLTHPITGAGIAAGVVSGERAGRAAAAYLAGDEGALEDYEEDVRDQFETTVKRAVARRRELAQFWRTRAANEDATQRRGWIAFNEYFQSAAV
jgi:digeranylgeranylglycerophospholipid reductase